MSIYINRIDDEEITVTAIRDGKPIGLYRLTNGHPAFGWSDERLESYIRAKHEETPE